MLLARGQPRDRERAAALLNEGLAISRQLGMHGLEERVVALLENTPSYSRPVLTYPGGLTRREVEVLQRIAAGNSNREIADALFISLYTVASHARNIRTNVGAANRTEAAAFAIRHGLTAFLPPRSEQGPP